MIDRLQSMFTTLRARGEKAMGLFLTNGFPDPESTRPLLEVIDEAGADFIELGMPFSDPLAEGVPIQRASERALRHGVRLTDAFRTAEWFRARSQTPLLLMGYVNPIYRYGYRAFCRDAAQAGVDGLILADLPPEESTALDEAAREAGLAMVYLIAPNTPDERIRAIDERATGFVYAVSVTGLTGSQLPDHAAVEAYLQRARRQVRRNPLLVGFGIKSHEDARRLSRHTDGFIVGSALIRLVERLWDDPALTPEERLASVRQFVHALKYGTPVQVGT
ncbi:tryptophan synthase subunit alpha [Rhodothermus marinus]|uniref:Tryptophan synthase alpha chain n=1 Tax=Rhodothermus marinus TaxID=29549 RepID=G1BJY4_RHOMR|nr:tryptophan synthase component A [Rhodothermus marinus]